MNLKFLAVSAAALIGVTASADVLYWQVNNSDAVVAESGYTTAYLMASYEGDAKSPYYVSSNLDAGGSDLGEAVGAATFNDDGYVAGVIDAAKILSWSDGPTAISAGNLSGLSFYVELFNAAGKSVAKSDAVAYSDLGSALSHGFNADFTGVNGGAFGGSASYSVPEPTSGLLMLIGMGALALRRRKAA